ncbi:MAG: TRAP transporter small permease subunit [bacterium]
MRGARSLVNIIDALNLKVGTTISWLSFSLVMLVVFDVIMRYLFKKSFVAVQETEWHIFAVYFLIGGGYTLLKDSHVRVDIFYQKMSARLKAWIDLLGVLFFLLPGCYLVIKTSSKFAWTSWMVREASADPGGLPGRYLLKAVVAVAFVLIALQGVSMGLKNLLLLLGGPLPETQNKGGH